MAYHLQNTPPEPSSSSVSSSSQALRILVITNLYPPHHVGGYEIRCAQVVRALQAKGHSVAVLTSDHSVSSAPSQPETGVSRSLRLHGFFGHPWLSIRQLAALEMHNNDLLRAEIERVKPDIIHVWNLGGISKSIIATLQLSHRTVVYDISDHWIARSLKADVWLDWWHRTTPSTPAQLLRTWWTLTRQQHRMAQSAPIVPVHALQFKHIYFCSAALRRITAEKGYPVEHAAVIHCPVDTQRFTGTPASPERPLRRLLYVGRLTEDKGIMTALRAMRALPPDRHGIPSSEFTLTVCGHGEADYVQQLHHYVQQHRLPVTFTHATPEHIPSVYASHDALLFTSEWKEPFALTPLEAMATGLPVIGTTTGGSAELLRHNHNSLTYRPADPAQLAKRILQLAADPQHRHRIATQGQQDVRTHCTEQLIISQIEAYLQQALAADQAETASRHRSQQPPQAALCKA